MFDISPRKFWFYPSVLMPKNKPRFTLAICLTSVSVFQVCYNILISLWEKFRGDFYLWEFFPARIIPMEIFHMDYLSFEEFIP